MSVTRMNVRGKIGVVAVGMLIVLGVIGAPANAAHQAMPSLRLVSQTLWVPTQGTVTAVIQTDQAPAGAKLVAIVHGPVPTRSAFALTLSGRGFTGYNQTVPAVALLHAAGQTKIELAVNMPTSDSTTTGPTPIRADRPGVYPIEFKLVAQSGETLRTMVSYFVVLEAQPTQGASGQLPLRVATEIRLNPVSTTNSLGSLTVSAETRQAVDALTNAMSFATSDVKRSFDYSISPALIAALAQTKDHARLRRLQTTTHDSSLQRAPWSAIDLARWLVTNGLAAQSSRLTRAGSAQLTNELHAPNPMVADLSTWGTPTTPRQIQWLVDRSSNAVLVPQELLSTLDTQDFPRTLTSPFLLKLSDNRSVTALQLDEALTDHFTSTDPTLGANQLVADLAVLGLDLPSVQRGVVVAAPANWKPSADFLSTYASYLGAAHPTGFVPLVVPTSLDDVATKTPLAHEGGDRTISGPSLVRTLRTSRNAAPIGTSAQTYLAARAQVQSLSTMVPGGTRHAASLTTSLQQRLDVAMQSGLSSSRRSQEFLGVHDVVAVTAGSLQLPDRQTITLTSKSATVPLTIRRSTNGPTVVRLSIDGQNRFDFPGGSTPLVYLHDTVTHLNLRVHTNSPGEAVLRLTVMSPDRGITVKSTTLVMRSTAASGVGLLITFGSLGFLLIWWARDIRNVRKRRRERHVPPSELIDIGQGNNE